MSKQCFKSSVLILTFLFAYTAAAAKPEPTNREKREPLVITSSRMEANKLGNKITFTGEVILKKEGMTLSSDKMIVFYDVRTKGIEEIEATGNVVVRKEGRVAHSNRASYYSREEKIILTGDARIIENENQLGGERIILFMRDERSIVEGGKVLFYQDKGTSEGRK